MEKYKKAFDNVKHLNVLLRSVNEIATVFEDLSQMEKAINFNTAKTKESKTIIDTITIELEELTSEKLALDLIIKEKFAQRDSIIEKAHKDKEEIIIAGKKQVEDMKSKVDDDNEVLFEEINNLRKEALLEKAKIIEDAKVEGNKLVQESRDKKNSLDKTITKLEASEEKLENSVAAKTVELSGLELKIEKTKEFLKNLIG